MNAPQPSTARPMALRSSSPTELAVRGMICSHCVRQVTEAIQSVPGVASAVVDLEQGPGVCPMATRPPTRCGGSCAGSGKGVLSG